MKTEAFAALLFEHTQRTPNIRALKKWNHSKVHEVDDTVTEKIGQVVDFLQAKIGEGLFCKKHECLIIYNFQPVYKNNNVYLCSLDMAIKPFKINENSEPVLLQLVVNGTTGEIGNTAYGLTIITGKETHYKNGTTDEKPLVYGNYHEIAPSKSSPCNFARQLDHLRITVGSRKEKGCKGRELKNQAELSESPILSFQFAEKPIPANTRVAQEFPISVQPVMEVDSKKVLHRLKGAA